MKAAKEKKPRIRFHCDWEYYNFVVFPTIYVGINDKPWSGWIYFIWGRGRLGFSRY